jgi:natural product biosynthesis luciferase-like monooxygenase protein
VELSLFFFGADTEEHEHGKYDLCLETAKFADTRGFRAVWVPERHFQRFGGLYGSPTVMASALAVLTRNLQIRAGSIVFPLWNPLRIAEEWAMIDNLSNGRAGIAVASGWHPDDFVLAPDSYEKRYAIMDENVSVVRRLWAGESLSFPNGEGEPTPVRIRPLPMQREVPIWLTTMGQEIAYQRAGERGYNILTANFAHINPDKLRTCIDIYRSEIRRVHGRDGHVTLMTHFYAGESQADIEQIARPAMFKYLEASMELWAKGHVHWKTRGERAREVVIDLQVKRNLGGDLSFIGTTEECRKKMASFVALGVNEIACLIDFGVSIADTLTSLERLSTLIEA